MAKKKVKNGFKCVVCGKWHRELLSDVACQLPDVVWGLEYVERYERSRYNPDLCTLDDKRFFIPGVLPIPFTYTDGFFGWGVWVEVSKQHHDVYVASFSSVAKSPGTFPGMLANNLRAYRKTMALAVSVELHPEHRPLVYLSSSSRHKLAIEQRKGIDLNRHHEIVEPFV